MFMVAEQGFPRLVSRGVLVMTFTILATWCQAASFLSEANARSRAIAILKGDPHGQSTSEVTKNILEGQLIMKGDPKLRDEMIGHCANNGMANDALVAL